MNMNKYILLLMLFFAGCMEKQALDAHLLIFEHDQIKEIEYIPFNMDEFIDSVRFIPLEISDKSIIGEISQMKKFEGNFYIHDRMTRRLMVFDRNGRYLRDIGRFGQGSGEFIAISAFVLNSTERKIGIFDPMRNVVLEYTLEGVYLGSVAFPDENASSFYLKTIYADGYIYSYARMNWLHNTAFTVRSAKDYSIIDRLRPYPISPSGQMAFEPMVHPFSFVNGRLYYVSLFSDVIFSYENGKESPFLLIETGKPNITVSALRARIEGSRRNRNRGIVNDPSMIYFELWRDRRYSSGFTELAKTERFLLAAHRLGTNYRNVGGTAISRPSFYLLDKKTNTGFYVKNGHIPNLGMPFLLDGNKLIRIWDQNSIEVYQRQIAAGDVDSPEIIKSLLKNFDPEDDNPIIVIYYMRE